jgi:excinuclease ABC subunit C
MEGTQLNERVRQAPHSAGVYFWRAGRGQTLYIGKAKDLRSRLSSYVKAKDARIAAMVAESSSLSWQTVPTEIEALILESTLIKRLRPKHNLAMRDDKRYLLVALTDELFPKFIPTHQAASRAIRKPVREYLGPFTESQPVHTTLRLLRGVFPTCSCKQTHLVRCLNAHLGLCPGYCCLKSPATTTQKREYARNIRVIRGILSGERDAVTARLERDMKRLAAVGKLMEARVLQMKIARVRSVFEHAQVTEQRRRTTLPHRGATGELAAALGLHREPQRIEGYDIAMIQGSHAAGAMVVFSEGRPDRAQYRLFNIAPTITGDVPMLRHVLERRLAHDEWPYPDLIVVDGAKAQLNAIRKAVASFRLEIPVIAVKKDARHQPEYLLTSASPQGIRLSEMPRALRDLVVHIDGEAHRFAISHYRKRHRRSVAP